MMLIKYHLQWCSAGDTHFAQSHNQMVAGNLMVGAGGAQLESYAADDEVDCMIELSPGLKPVFEMVAAHMPGYDHLVHHQRASFGPLVHRCHSPVIKQW